MRNLPLASCVLAACLLGALLYFGYQITQTALRYSKAKELRDTWFADDQAPAPDEIDEALADADAALKKYNTVEFKALKAELLLYKAWYYPQESIKPLRNSLPLALEVYRGSEEHQGYAGWQVAWGLHYAHLPSRLERWADQVRVQAPYMRPALTALVIESKLLVDDVDGIRAAVEQELEGRENYLESKIVAIDGLLIIDDIDAAVELEPALEDQKNLDVNQLMVLVELSLETQHFAQAREQLKEVEKRLPNDPGIALTHALVEIALDGVNSGPANRWIDRATQSTRRPLSREAVLALVYAELVRVTDDEKWISELTGLAEQHPDDYDVQAAAAYQRLREIVDEGLEGTKTEQFAAVSGLAQQFEQVQTLVTDEIQHQESWFRLAEAYAVAGVYADNAEEDSAAQDYLSRAVVCLRRGLGDPEVVDSVITECPADYGGLLLNDLVRAARVRWADFDKGIHESIIDYLNRRIDIFSDLPGLKPMNHLPYVTGGNEQESPKDAPTEPGEDDGRDWQPA